MNTSLFETENIIENLTKYTKILKMWRSDKFSEHIKIELSDIQYLLYLPFYTFHELEMINNMK